MKNYQLYHFWHPIMEEDTGAGSGSGTPPNPEMTFDDFLKDPKHQAEFDRRMTKGQETARIKWEQEANARLEEEKNEAAKLARMTAEQKAEHERQKREAEMAKREAALTLRELRATATETLTQQELPMALLDCLDFTNAESCNASIEKVGKAFRDAVQAGVESRMKGSTPGAAILHRVTKQEILQEKDPAKRQKLIAENISLFR